jgi:hypothetical protein
VASVSGRYFSDLRPIPSISESYDEQSERLLWEVSLELTGLLT